MAKKFKCSVFLLLLMMLSCSSASDSGNGKPILTVSIEPQRKMLEEIAGDSFEVVSILGAGINPETYEPSIRQRSAVDQSKAFFVTGHLPFESRLISTANPNVRVIDTSEGIVPVTGTHKHNGRINNETNATEPTLIEGADPHIWTSYPNAMIMVSNMGRAMTEIDPENAETYEERADAIMSRLDSLNSATARAISGKGVHAFAVWHPSLSYYARDYGLHQITVGNEGKEMSASSMRKAIDEARSDSVTTLFFQKEYDLRQAEAINSGIGSRLVIINPLAYRWENELQHITDELTR